MSLERTVQINYFCTWCAELCLCIIIISHLVCFPCILLTSNHMIFFRAIWNKQALINFFKDHKKKITRACLFQIALEIMWLPLLNYADFKLGKDFRLFQANHVDCIYITLKRTFLLFCCLITLFSVFFACLQLITLIVALSQSQQHFCIFAAKLRSFQLSPTKNRFCTCLLLLRCFQLFLH